MLGTAFENANVAALHKVFAPMQICKTQFKPTMPTKADEAAKAEVLGQFGTFAFEYGRRRLVLHGGVPRQLL